MATLHGAIDRDCWPEARRQPERAALQEQEGDAEGSAATLRRALDWWRSSMASSGNPAAAETEQWLLQVGPSADQTSSIC